MSTYPKKFPRSFPALFVRLKESRFAARFDRRQVFDFQELLRDPIKRRIWIYWGQGWENAPAVVKRCAKSWADKNPDWKIELIDDLRLAKLISKEGVPKDVNLTKKSNVWRMRLLESHGGVWADATVFCCRPLSDWLPMLAAPTGSFFFKTPTPNRPYASWFMARFGESYLLDTYRPIYERYLYEYGDRHTFALHFVFDYLLRTDRRFAAEYAAMPSVSAAPALAYGRWLADPIKWPKPDPMGVPMQKLSWKIPIDLSDVEALLGSTLHDS